MKCKFKTLGGALEFEVENNSVKDIFEELAHIEEIFGQTCCGKCKKTSLAPVVRVVDDNKYYEMKCKSCGAALSYGQNKKGGGMFPKKYKIVEDGKEKKKVYDNVNGGWYKYNETNPNVGRQE